MINSIFNFKTLLASVPMPASLPATFDAWHVVALGAGAFLVQAYHLIVNAGGLKRIGAKFWGGAEAGSKAAAEIDARPGASAPSSESPAKEKGTV